MLHEFVIRPNRSLSDQGRNYLLYGIGLIMGLVTLRFLILGGWMVLPFMFADLLALVVAFCIVGQKCRITERVVIAEDKLAIHHEEAHQPMQWAFPLHWVNVELRPALHPSHGSRLLIGSHGNWVELAGFLTNTERESLALAIRQAILDARQPKWIEVELGLPEPV